MFVCVCVYFIQPGSKTLIPLINSCFKFLLNIFFIDFIYSKNFKIMWGPNRIFSSAV